MSLGGGGVVCQSGVGVRRSWASARQLSGSGRPAFPYLDRTLLAQGEESSRSALRSHRNDLYSPLITSPGKETVLFFIKKKHKRKQMTKGIMPDAKSASFSIIHLYY